VSNDAGRTTKVTWDTAEEKKRAEYYCLGKGPALPDFMKFAFNQYMGRYKLKAAEIARADKILADRASRESRAMPVQATASETTVADRKGENNG
jgi:hypothetical protein